MTVSSCKEILDKNRQARVRACRFLLFILSYYQQTLRTGGAGVALTAISRW